jgi:dephospho-CoA kinase
MLRVGLTGGLATGKSFVGHELERLGCTVIRADEIGHEVLAPGGAAYQDVADEFGTAFLRHDGTIDRTLLAQEVFSKPARLQVLNSIVHPAVFRIEDELMEATKRRDPTGIVVVEAAILIETGSYKRYNRLIVAVCPVEQQVARALERAGYTPEIVSARLRQQLPIEEKRKFADYVIDTSGSKERTLEQTRRVYEELRSIQI